MANRNFNKKQALEHEIKDLYVKFLMVSGDPVDQSVAGVASVSKNGTGDYTITLQDKFNALKHASAIVLASDAQDLVIQVKEEDVASAKTVRVLVTEAGTAADPTDDSAVLVHLQVKNTSLAV